MEAQKLEKRKSFLAVDLRAKDLTLQRGGMKLAQCWERPQEGGGGLADPRVSTRKDPRDQELESRAPLN